MAHISELSDILPLPANLKQDFRDIIVARYGDRIPGPQEFELLWRMIESSTWEYRQTAPIDDLSVQHTVNSFNHLRGQLHSELGLSYEDFEELALVIIRLGVCAGFFGLGVDQSMLMASAPSEA